MSVLLHPFLLIYTVLCLICRCKVKEKAVSCNEFRTFIVRKQPDVENGEIAIVLVNGDEATIKKVQKKANMPQDGYPDYQLLQKINRYNPKVGFAVPVPERKLHK